jgi:hypothetical protein
MAYRATPHGSSGFSPYYLLHGREMILPIMQDIRAKMPPEVRGTDYAGRLENLVKFEVSLQDSPTEYPQVPSFE